MAVKINMHDTKIPIDMGSLTFYFDMGDAPMKEIRRKFTELKEKAVIFEKLDEKNIEDMSDDDMDKLDDEIKEFCEEAFAFLLGEGSFEKLYAISPSTSIMGGYFYAVIEGLQKEMAIRNGLIKTAKYIGQVSQ